jgi:KUP system potassium uptake protein
VDRAADHRAILCTILNVLGSTRLQSEPSHCGVFIAEDLVIDRGADARGLHLGQRTRHEQRTSGSVIPGTAVFMTASPDGVPHALQHNLKHNKVLHENVVIVTVAVEEVPYVGEDQRIEIIELEQGFRRVILRFGFMQETNVPAELAKVPSCSVDLARDDISYFLGRQTIIATKLPGMALWRERLFGWMMRTAETPMQFFRLPSTRVIELGSQVEI